MMKKRDIVRIKKYLAYYFPFLRKVKRRLQKPFYDNVLSELDEARRVTIQWPEGIKKPFIALVKDIPSIWLP